MSDLPRYVTENLFGRERSSVPDEASTVTKRLWLRKARRSTLLMQPLGVHGRRVLNGSSVPWTTWPRRKSGPQKRIAGTGSDPESTAIGAHGATGIRDPISSPKRPLEQCIQDWLRKPRQKLFRHAGDSCSQSYWPRGHVSKAYRGSARL